MPEVERLEMLESELHVELLGFFKNQIKHELKFFNNDGHSHKIKKIFRIK